MEPERMATREEIFAVDDIEERVVVVPQWRGLRVRIRTLTQKQASDLRKRASRTNMVTKQQEIDNDLLEALLFTEGVVDPKFTMADYGKLQEKSAAAMTTILKEVMDASGLTDTAVKEATKSDEEELGDALRVPVGAGVEDDAR